LILFFEDNGTGIPYDLKERIFEQEYGRGTGLSLFLSCEILSITGITIRETGDSGRGARFEITVPKGVWRFDGNQ
jgi:signal transduction histidine kinase